MDNQKMKVLPFILMEKSVMGKSLYVILHELAEGSSKCFKCHYLVSIGVSINIIGHVFFVFVRIFFCVDLWRLDFTVDLH
jgi:hypothetical protein